MLRRLLMRWLPVAVLATIAATAAMPTTAGAATSAAVPPECAANARPMVQPAYCSQYATRLAGLGHVGWVHLELNSCAPGLMCAEIYRSTTSAWRWTGRSWVQASISGGWVYVYPYSGQWRWAWTQASGWVAISGNRFELRS